MASPRHLAKAEADWGHSIALGHLVSWSSTSRAAAEKRFIFHHIRFVYNRNNDNVKNNEKAVQPAQSPNATTTLIVLPKKRNTSGQSSASISHASKHNRPSRSHELSGAIGFNMSVPTGSAKSPSQGTQTQTQVQAQTDKLLQPSLASYGPTAPSSSSSSSSSPPIGGFRIWLSQPVVASFVAGGVAGAVSRTVVSPLERLKILFQIQSVGREDYKMPIGKALAKMWREEGFRGLMAGNGTNCIRIVPYSAVQFGSYNFYKRVSIYLAMRDSHRR